MANSWLRLWHDMPNDPKWRTIAKVSKQSIPAVMAVYIHLLVIASNATERGRTQSVCSEDIASALDLDAEQIDAILEAMQGRVLDGDMVRGWAKRQVEREDGSAERAKRWREAQKAGKQTPPNAGERKQTPDTDTDTDTEEKKDKAQAPSFLLPAWVPVEAWHGYVEMRKKIRKPMTDRAMQLRVNVLKKFADAGHDPAAVLDNSTANDWTDLYAPKKGAVQSAPKNWAEKPAWVVEAGFDDVADANSSRCYEHNAAQFQNGKRLEAA